MTPVIIPFFLPSAGCRERCLFCNQKAKEGGIPSPSAIQNLIQASLALLPPDKKTSEKQVAFYGGSFTGMNKEDQVSCLKAARPFLSSGVIDSIRISTRPDALDAEALSLLKEQGVKTVEIGVQSMIDQVLLLANRGHRGEDTRSGVSRLRQWGFEVGLQLMIGLPGDTFEFFLQTLDSVVDVKPDFVRIHPTLVLKGAPLESLWGHGKYTPLRLDETIQWLKRGLLKLERSSIRVARVGLQPTKEMEKDFIAGPYHPALRHLIDSEIAFDMADHLLQASQRDPQSFFLCHPKEVSNVRGQRNGNILKLKKRFQLKEMIVQSSVDVARDSLFLQTRTGRVSMQRRELPY